MQWVVYWFKTVRNFLNLVKTNVRFVWSILAVSYGIEHILVVFGQAHGVHQWLRHLIKWFFNFQVWASVHTFAHHELVDNFRVYLWIRIWDIRILDVFTCAFISFIGVSTAMQNCMDKLGYQSLRILIKLYSWLVFDCPNAAPWIASSVEFWYTPKFFTFSLITRNALSSCGWDFYKLHEFSLIFSTIKFVIHSLGVLYCIIGVLWVGEVDSVCALNESFVGLLLVLLLLDVNFGYCNLLFFDEHILLVWGCWEVGPSHGDWH